MCISWGYYLCLSDSDSLLLSELIYCGQCLRDDKPLKIYGVENDCTLFAFKRQKVKPTEDSGIRLSLLE